jgi:hypothetical protein
MQFVLRFVCSLFGIAVVGKSKQRTSRLESTFIRDSAGQLDLPLNVSGMTPVQDSTSEQGSPRLREYARRAGTATACNAQKGSCKQ